MTWADLLIWFAGLPPRHQAVAHTHLAASGEDYEAMREAAEQAIARFEDEQVARLSDQIQQVPTGQLVDGSALGRLAAAGRRLASGFRAAAVTTGELNDSMRAVATVASQGGGGQGRFPHIMLGAPTTVRLGVDPGAGAGHQPNPWRNGEDPRQAPELQPAEFQAAGTDSKEPVSMMRLRRFGAKGRKGGDG